MSLGVRGGEGWCRHPCPHRSLGTPSRGDSHLAVVTARLAARCVSRVRACALYPHPPTLSRPGRCSTYCLFCATFLRAVSPAGPFVRFLSPLIVSESRWCKHKKAVLLSIRIFDEKPMKSLQLHMNIENSDLIFGSIFIDNMCPLFLKKLHVAWLIRKIIGNY